MKNSNNLTKIAFVLLGFYLGCMTVPSYVHAQTSEVTTAENQINDYFNAILAGTNVPTVQSAQSFINGVMSSVLIQADQQTVYAYYKHHAISTAEAGIAKFFSAISAGTITPTAQGAQSFVSTIMAPVLVAADQQAVYTYYEQHAVSTAQAGIAKFFSAVAAGNITPTAQGAQSFVSTIMAPVLVPADQQAVYTYYEQHAVSTAQAGIAKFFSAVAAGSVTPTMQGAQSFVSTIMAPVLVAADQQAVYTYYEQHAVSTAQAGIAKFFSAVAAGSVTPTMQGAQSFVSTIMAPVLVAADQQAVYTYYEQHAVSTADAGIAKFFSAISAGTITPTTQGAQSFVSTIMAPVLVPADQQAVYTYYEQHAVSTAEAGIAKFFSAISAGTITPTTQGAQSFVSTIMAPVLVPADQQVVYAYYEQHAVSTAEAGIAKFFSAISAGTITPTTQGAQSFVSTIMAPVLVPADQQAVYTYYEQHAVSTAQAGIAKFFSAVAAGNITPTAQGAQSFVSTIMAPVLVPADQQVVYTYYEQHAVSTAQAGIAKFFSAISAGTITPTAQGAQSFVSTIMAPVLVAADQQAVYTYYEQHAVSTADAGIAKFFSAISAGTITPTAQGAQSFVSTIMAPVLVAADQQVVYAYYEQHAVSTAQAGIAKFFSAISAGTITPTAQGAQSFVSTIMAPVLVAADQQAVYTYYEQHAVSTADAGIAKFFSAISAGTITPTAQGAQSFVSTIMAPVLVAADQQVVYAYYEQHAVSTAEAGIVKFFNAVAAGTITLTPQSAQSFEASVMAPVLAQADQNIVAAYYNNAYGIYLYHRALNIINNYVSAPSAVTLLAAQNAVILVQPYNNIASPNQTGVGLYDALVNQLVQDVINYLVSIKKISNVTAALLNDDNSFASDVAIDGNGNVFVSDPAGSNSGEMGVINELTTDGKTIHIAPVSPNPNNHFGSVFAVTDDVSLVASDVGLDGNVNLDIFQLQNHQWVQTNKISLLASVPAGSVIKSINQVSLSLSVHSMAVGLPQYGVYLSFGPDYLTSLSPASVITFLEPNTVYQSRNVSVNVSHYFTVSGDPAYDSINIVNGKTGALFPVGRFLPAGVTGFGQSVAVFQTPPPATMVPGAVYPGTVTVAIGSPNENDGTGAVWTITGNFNFDNTGAPSNVTWGSLVQVNLFMTSTTKHAGSHLSFKGGLLTVSADQGIAMVYKKADGNQWSWTYTNGQPRLSNTTFGISSLASNSNTVVIGGQNSANCSTFIGNCPQSFEQTVSP